jgi:hypothetical protein
MSAQHTSIFEDLGIDFSDMMTDHKAFSERCLAEERKLADILKSDTSVKTFERRVLDEAAEASTPDKAVELFDAIYELGDTVSLPELARMIESARTLVKDLETALHQRAVIEATTGNSPVSDKRFAHYQHTKLREAYEQYRKFVASFFKVELKMIKGISGNFGSSLSPLERFTFEINGEQFMSPHPVIRRLGKSEELHTIADLLEYIEANPDAPVIVRKVVI